MPRRNLLLIFVVSVAALLCYRQVSHQPYARRLSHVLTQIDREALKQVPQQDLFDGAMEGIVGRLDRYSAYIPKTDAQTFREGLDQEIGGIGVMIELVGEDKHQLKVINPPFYGTPAQRAGLRVMDEIIEINGEPVGAMMNMQDVIRKMRGEVGSPITLMVRHEGEDIAVEYTLTREMIKVPSVRGDRPLENGKWRYRLDDQRIAYIRLDRFGEKTAGELEEALDQATGAGARAAILDLRDNSGGLLDAAVDTCDMFLPEGKRIVETRRRNEQLDRAIDSSDDGQYKDLPLAVLVNGFSASASEIVAACLQDHDRAVIVGERTWGKGTVQHLIPVGDGSLLKLTAASYWRPSGKNIHRMDHPGEPPTEEEANGEWGVRPNEDFVVKLDEKEVEKVRDARRERDRYRPEGVEGEDQNVDRQLQRAIEYLQDRLGAHSETTVQKPEKREGRPPRRKVAQTAA